MAVAIELGREGLELLVVRGIVVRTPVAPPLVVHVLTIGVRHRDGQVFMYVCMYVH